MKTKTTRIVDDLSPRLTQLLKQAAPVAWGRNSLDVRGREPFTDKEAELARGIGSPPDVADDASEHKQ